MTVSDHNRARFEDIGLSAIRRELAVGSVAYLGIDEDLRKQAREWVNEKLVEESRDKATTRLWIATGGVAGVVAAVAACIAAWPVIKAWFRWQ